MKTRLLIIIGIIATIGILPIPGSFAEKIDSQNMGQMEWSEINNHSKIPAYKIQVIDKDMDENTDKIDKIEIHVWSDSDPAGIIVSLYETEKDSGIFDSLVYFSEDVSTGQRLHVLDGDAVTAAYEDRTLPASSKKLEVSDTITIHYSAIDLLENKNSFIRIEDETFSRQSLQTAETISESGTLTAIIMSTLGPILIVLFIVIYAVKKRMKKSIEEKK